MSRNLRALQWELVNHLDAMPLDEWTPEMLQAATLILKIAGVKPVQFVGKPKLTLVQGGA